MHDEAVLRLEDVLMVIGGLALFLLGLEAFLLLFGGHDLAEGEADGAMGGVDGSDLDLNLVAGIEEFLGGDALVFETKNADKFLEIVKGIRFVKSVKKHGNRIAMGVESGEKRIPELMALAQKNNVLIESVSLRKPSLEDVFLQFTGKTIRESEASQRERNMEFARRRFGR